MKHSNTLLWVVGIIVGITVLPVIAIPLFFVALTLAPVVLLALPMIAGRALS